MFQGDEHQYAEKNSTTYYIEPAIGFKLGVTESVSVHGWTGYKVLGEDVSGDGTTSDNNEWESVIGFKASL